MNYDLAIIGGGPAGLIAANRAADSGLKTVLIEESYSIGGQLRQQAQLLKELPAKCRGHTGIELAQLLIESLVSKDVAVLLKHTMIGVYKDNSIGVSNGKTTFPIHAKRILITTGASEEAALFPGWTLPGVMTIGAAQILLNRERVFPGKAVLIFGFNYFSLDVAKQFVECGLKVHGVVDGKRENEADFELFQEFKTLGITVYFNSSIEKVYGKHQVEKAVLNSDGDIKEIFLDLVCISNGLSPISDSFELLDCELTYESELGGRVPYYGSYFETTNPTVFVAGNAAGITNIGGVMITSEIAVMGIANDLGIIEDASAKKQKDRLWEELEQAESNRFRKVHDTRISLTNKFPHSQKPSLQIYVKKASKEAIDG